MIAFWLLATRAASCLLWEEDVACPRNYLGVMVVMALCCLFFCPVAWGAQGEKEIVFIDAAVGDTWPLAKGLGPGVEVVRLQAWRDGVRQMAEELSRRQGLDAVHIIAQGAPGKVILGIVELSTENMDTYGEQMKLIGASIREGGSITISGCNLAQGVAGQNFLEKLAELTRIEVAASKNSTAPAALAVNRD
jgi:trehalose utilization protein